MAYLPHALALFLLVSPAAVLAQAEAPAASTTPEGVSAADLAYEPLGRTLRNLYESLRAQRGLTAKDRSIVESVREQFEDFSLRFPSDTRGPAGILLLSSWLKDDQRVEEAYARLLEIDPGNVKAALSLGKRYIAANRFDEAIRVLRRPAADPAANPEAALLLSDAMFAQERFDDALHTLDSIPQETLDANLDLKFKADQVRRTREEYVELWSTELALRDAEEQAGDLPRVMMVTSQGQVVIELFENQAPNTVANFITLTEQGFFNGTKFHEVVAGSYIAGGDPTTRDESPGAQSNPGYYIADEHDRIDRRNHFAGSIAMQREQGPDRSNLPNTAGSKFYITFQPVAHLNGTSTVFGRVVGGLDVVRSLKKDDVIESAVVVRKREHSYTPEILPLTGDAADAQPAAEPQPEVSAPADVPSEDTTAGDAETEEAPTPGNPETNPDGGSTPPADGDGR